VLNTNIRLKNEKSGVAREEAFDVDMGEPSFTHKILLYYFMSPFYDTLKRTSFNWNFGDAGLAFLPLLRSSDAAAGASRR
ncbi:hypothetical protein, partial [Paenibacillus graminis]|uniref:hypothetical protein n=1 Tax=Paenibacillus graminis TaxID=189425 RepID=UPI002DB55F13